MNITIKLFIFELVKVSIFTLNWQLWLFWTKFAKKVSYFQSKKHKIDTTIEFCIFELVFVSNYTLNNFESLDQICPRNIFVVKKEKVNIIIEFRLFKLVLVPNFSLNWQFWFFWPDLPKKGFSGLKQKIWTPDIFYKILFIQVILVRDFS